MLFTGNANPALAQEIANNLGISLGKASVGRFSDGETTVEIQQNVRGREVFVVQSTCAPTNDNLMELVVMIDAVKRSSAKRITAVIPYYGYARQDRRLLAEVVDAEATEGAILREDGGPPLPEGQDHADPAPPGTRDTDDVAGTQRGHRLADGLAARLVLAQSVAGSESRQLRPLVTCRDNNGVKFAFATNLEQ